MDRDRDPWVRADEARARLRDLLDTLARDDNAYYYVLRYEKPAGVLVSVDWYERAKAQLSDRGPQT